MARSVADRFWDRVARGPGCWEWTRSLHDGYGLLSVDGKSERAHRVSWVLHFGPIPDGLLVCHHCDNRACVRPDHLFLGTIIANNLDRDRKGRYMGPRGEQHGSAKLTWAIVREIRSSDAPTKALARKYGVNQHTLKDARCGKTWVESRP